MVIRFTITSPVYKVSIYTAKSIHVKLCQNNVVCYETNIGLYINHRNTVENKPQGNLLHHL